MKILVARDINAQSALKEFGYASPMNVLTYNIFSVVCKNINI